MIPAITSAPGFDGRDGGRFNEHSTAQEPDAHLALIEALRITEANLSSLVAGGYRNFEPWHRMVKDALSRAGVRP